LSDSGPATPRDPATRYSDRVADYERYRPGYPAHASLQTALRDLFDRFAENGSVAMLYDTHLYLGRLDT
jgi:hypothetical protein